MMVKDYIYAFCTLTKIISLAWGHLSTSERILGVPSRVIDIILNFKVNLAVHYENKLLNHSLFVEMPLFEDDHKSVLFLG